ncbi:hypothetical protein [Devosia sp. Leaf64]|uniref:hypothetical protein n=1 Tax=Devosia sp. Leaf64 TaxID=1736229 RepID=UPI000ACAE6DE|nr:hypothetical protein [Devosia sp. Leaf64]
MSTETIVMVLLSLALLVTVRLAKPEKFGSMLRGILDQFKSVAFTAPAGFVIAAFVSTMLPAQLVAGVLGEASGFGGILFASIAGAFIPGGPMVSYPIVLTIGHLGAGHPQMIAFVTGWSLFAFHRIVSYELPLMGTQFLKVRLISTAMLPPLAGVVMLLLRPIFQGAI